MENFVVNLLGNILGGKDSGFGKAGKLTLLIDSI